MGELHRVKLEIYSAKSCILSQQSGAVHVERRLRFGVSPSWAVMVACAFFPSTRAPARCRVSHETFFTLMDKKSSCASVVAQKLFGAKRSRSGVGVVIFAATDAIISGSLGGVGVELGCATARALGSTTASLGMGLSDGPVSTKAMKTQLWNEYLLLLVTVFSA